MEDAQKSRNCLLAIDIDGTLLTHERRIHPANAAAIARARAAGVTVALASGRILTSMMPFVETLGLDGPRICANGTHVMITPDEELYHCRVSDDILLPLLEYSDRHRLHLNLYTRTELFFLRDTKWGEMYKTRVETIQPRLLDQDPRGLELSKVMIVDSPERVREHSQYFTEFFPVGTASITESEPEYLEFLPPGGSKGYALERLSERMGIPRERIFAIGDFLNDLEMIQFAGTSAAMGNAHPSLKQAATVTVSSNDEAGVAEFIDDFVLKERQ